MKKSAVVYVRVSSARQVENFSLDTQERLCRDYCAAQGWPVALVFREQGESARSADRTELQRMLTHCREHRGEVGAVMVHSLSRWSREQRDHHALRGLLTAWGITLRSATEPISDDPAGEFLEGIIASAAQFENRLRTARTREGMKAALAAGRSGHRSATRAAVAVATGSRA